MKVARFFGDYYYLKLIPHHVRMTFLDHNSPLFVLNPDHPDQFEVWTDVNHRGPHLTVQVPNQVYTEWNITYYSDGSYRNGRPLPNRIRSVRIPPLFVDVTRHQSIQMGDIMVTCALMREDPDRFWLVGYNTRNDGVFMETVMLIPFPTFSIHLPPTPKIMNEINARHHRGQ